MQGKVSIQTPKTAVINLPEAYEPLTNLILDSKNESSIDKDHLIKDYDDS